MLLYYVIKVMFDLFAIELDSIWRFFKVEFKIFQEIIVFLHFSIIERKKYSQTQKKQLAFFKNTTRKKEGVEGKRHSRHHRYHHTHTNTKDK